MPRARAHRVGIFAAEQTVAAAPTQEDEITVAMDGDTIFNSTETFLSTGLVLLTVNGQRFALGTHFTFVGTTITWLDNPFTLKAGDCIVVIYNHT